MNVISKRGLRKLIEKRPATEREVLDWYRIANASDWSCLTDVRKTFPNADLIGEALVFDIDGNRYRLITTVFFAAREIYVKALLTHKEYDREDWKKWC